MAQYIDKSAVVAEAEKIREHIKRLRYAVEANCIVTVRNVVECLESSIDLLVNGIDTLEVKEVDLEKEIELVKGDYAQVDVARNKDFDFIAKHFFELGLKARTDKELVEEVYSHLDSIKDTADKMTSGNFMHHRAAIKFSVNVIEKVLGLIGLKIQKGE